MLLILHLKEVRSASPLLEYESTVLKGDRNYVDKPSPFNVQYVGFIYTILDKL